MTSTANDSIKAVYQRLNFSIAVLLIAGVLTFLSFREWKMTGGFLIGGVIAVFNFMVLKRTVSAVGEVVVEGKATRSVKRQVVKFFFRYVLLAAVLYVIFKSSAVSVYGLFMGLFLPVGAILIEAVYELFGALRHRT
ncbi:MAG TPA: ATP synthase subunit I [Candidatus Angelobacter sp.]|nr:ATP synthase subunit I [Candidatus Angelobacter sp.]